jgi:transcriptional regulator with XRE-family HTH domain
LLVYLSMNITERIRHIRESKGLTQEDIAERFSVTRSNYAYLEGRGKKLTIEQLQKIAEALGVGIGELMGLDVGEAKEAKEDTEWFEQRITELENMTKVNMEQIMFLYKHLSNYEQFTLTEWQTVVFESAFRFGMIAEGDYMFFNINFDDKRIDLRKIYREVIHGKNSFLEFTVRYNLFGQSPFYGSAKEKLRQYQLEIEYEQKQLK